MTTTGAPAFRLVDNWEQLPDGFHHQDVPGVAVDSQDRVYLITRGEPRVIVYEPDGRFVTSWGEEIFTPRTHGISVGPDDSIYCVDDGDHTVRKFTPDGRLLLTLGTVGVPSDTGYDGQNLATITHGGPPFNRCTNVAVGPNGNLYVSDGYGNARIHRFSPSGELRHSWGEPGDGPGQFNLPHSVWVHRDGRVFVCDRENDRIQIFTPDGELLTIWTNVTRPGDLYIDAADRVYVGEMAWELGDSSMAGKPWPEARAASVSVRDIEGNVLTQWGGPGPCEPGNFSSPHGLWVDSRGDLYVAEVSQTALSRYGRWRPDCHSLQKFARVPAGA
jgi:hypothetical protein